jgi:hypothetical protein
LRSRQADDVARLLGDAALPPNLTVLDLSLGNLSEEGRSLFYGDWLNRLETLDLRHHFLPDNLMWRFSASSPTWTYAGRDRTPALRATTPSSLRGGQYLRPGGSPGQSGPRTGVDRRRADDWNLRRMRHLDGFRLWRSGRWRRDAEDAETPLPSGDGDIICHCRTVVSG